MANANTPTVLIVDDETQIRRFLGISLRAQGYQVIETGSGRDALVRLAAGGINLLILDLGLPDMDGREVLRELRGWSTLPVLVLSVRAREADKVALLDAGANDYLTKPFGVQELAARLRALLRWQREEGGSPVFDDGQLRIDPGRRLIERDNQPITLTRKEWALLALLLQHRGRVVTQPQLLRELWGPVHEHDTHYLRILAGKLRGKIGDDAAAPRYIQTEAGVGLRFIAADSAQPPPH